MTNANLIAILRAAGVTTREMPSAEELEKISEMLRLSTEDPSQLVVALVQLLRRVKTAEQNCAKAAEAATKLEEMLQGLLTGNKLLCRLETLRETAAGVRAICRWNGQIRELPIHPEVDVEQLKLLRPWDYVAVNEQVLVGFWTGDPYLFSSAQGDVVELRGYKDREQHQVHVAEHGTERVVELADSLWDLELLPRTKLVLQRDNPHRAISTVPAEHSRSRFEVPIDKIHTRLEDLAGVEEISEKLIEDLLLRVYFQDVCQRFGLEPLKGIMLYSKPGMGKTALLRAIALWLHEHRDELDFDVVLYVVKPNETKSMWHGEDARIMREELWGAIRARQLQPRTRPLIQLVVLDELDSLGKRASGRDPVLSAAQSDALEALLVEMDGMIQESQVGGPPVHVLCAGMTNRPDRVDEAAKRPGRFDLILSMPDVNEQGAEDVMAIYARAPSLPWQFDEEPCSQAEESRVRQLALRPAIARVFPAVVLRYKTDTQRSIDVTAGQILANAHYKDAMNRAKKRAAARSLRKIGIPAVTPDDVIDSLLDVAGEFARQMAADPQMLIRQLDIKVPVASVDVVPKDELDDHRYINRSA